MCEDFDVLNWKLDPSLLICYYYLEGGSDNKDHDHLMYWFGDRPDIADPKRLRRSGFMASCPPGW